jgi:hypothetical protein
LVAALLLFGLGDWLDGIVIVAILVVNAALGAIQEGRGGGAARAFDRYWHQLPEWFDPGESDRSTLPSSCPVTWSLSPRATGCLQTGG